jgi:hypothetical protein
MRHGSGSVVVVAMMAIVACGGGGAPAERCVSSADCVATEICLDGVCTARAPGSDAGTDAGPTVPGDGAADACAVPCGTGCCGAGERCTAEGNCLLDLGPCDGDGVCLDDSYCVEGRCAPYGTGPRGDRNDLCRRAVLPGRFAPAIQCRWDGPPAGDPLPGFREVESTALVVDFAIGRGADDPVRPSIVFISAQDFAYGDRGALRIIDGRTCADQGLLAAAEDRVGAATTPAVGDLDGDGRPEIVAKSGEGGLVAFGYAPARAAFERLWFSRDASGSRDRSFGSRAIPSLSIADLDDDGAPEILMGAVVYAADGTLLDAAQGLHDIVSYSQPPVVADIDHDADAELVTGDAVFDWDRIARRWVPRPWAAARTDGFVAVADFGSFPMAAGDFDGGPEIAVISNGTARVQSIGGDVVFGPIALPGGSHGGNPTIADFDGDGRAEIASGGPGSLTVFDLDCSATGATGECASSGTDGVLWTRAVRDFSSGINGSSVFDFEGDGRAEVVYADECYLRVFDGRSGDVVWSAPRSSGTWIEAPIVADADGDYNAEIVVGSNSRHGPCPALDPLHAGLTCDADADCPTGGRCDAGLCRCTSAAECGDPDSYACTAALPGTSGAGNVCRAQFTADIVGIRVYADASDRWVSSRRIWNQHAYAVTNVREDGTIPRTSEVQRNWSTPGLNDFRRNVQGDLVPLAGPDLTIGRGSFERTCTPSSPVIPLRAEVCNRGAEPVDSGMVATFFDGDPRASGTPICSATTTRTLPPGMCEPVACDWDPAPTEGVREVYLFVDRDDDNVECVETNNVARIASVGCVLI